jgi:hypothetical protein
MVRRKAAFGAFTSLIADRGLIPLAEAAVQRFWIPAQECASRPKLAP